MAECRKWSKNLRDADAAHGTQRELLAHQSVNSDSTALLYDPSMQKTPQTHRQKQRHTGRQAKRQKEDWSLDNET